MPTTATLAADCEHCAGPLPLMARSHARYCSSACKQAAYRARRKATDLRLAGERAARIPSELTSRARWVRYSSKKIPLRTDGRFAAVDSPASWSDFSAVDASSVGGGFGFVLTALDRIVVVDLDHAVVNGQVLPWAQRIVDALPPTYMERGRSGTGLHLWFRGEVAAGRRIRKNELAVELYSDRRYMIVGDRVSGTPLGLAELPDAAGVIASLV
ncbi:bifunctional DNA primase/polymerase [Streptomyces sp. NBC_01498]|uniref:bifunctional DNA primase/polymerase n=1 Tax=Streptomyces sp. NBC_01498 TaxID=2975870 RepID=UPI002E7C05A9|nr:bifunctional DNA primase/polymerase [Streptomyces sp. NBC_01498]WTL23970.1 bifunctional DNA primase/polymerase [Streptomyces sp. NBC_01498]